TGVQTCALPICLAADPATPVRRPGRHRTALLPPAAGGGGGGRPAGGHRPGAHRRRGGQGPPARRLRGPGARPGSAGVPGAAGRRRTVGDQRHRRGAGSAGHRRPGGGDRRRLRGGAHRTASVRRRAGRALPHHDPHSHTARGESMTATLASPTTSAPAVPLRRPSLARLTMVELRKLVDTRAGVWLMVAIVLSCIGFATIQLFALDPALRRFEIFFLGTLLPIGILLPVLGILTVTSEWSQRTALTTFALVP